MSNGIFPNRHLAENHFYKTAWSDVISPNIIKSKRRFGLIIDVSVFGEITFGKMIFGWTMIRENEVRLNNDSEKWLPAKQRLLKMTFSVMKFW